MIKVLWIDDQHDDAEMIQFQIEAEHEGFLLEGYKSFEEGFEALERNLDLYDVILLDGMFFEKKGQDLGTEDEVGIGMAIARINELKTLKVFPFFVLSGKENFTKTENPFLKANKSKCFDKTNPSDITRLFNELRMAALELPDAQLKHKYQNVLEACSSDLLGEENFSRLLLLAKHVEDMVITSNTEDMLNSLRKIIERIFICLGEKEIIPQTILNNRGWINGCRRFLRNNHSEFEQVSELVPRLVSENIYRLLNIVQDASHAEGELRFNVDAYIKSSKSDYFYRSCIFLLFDLILWFKEFLPANSDIALNKTGWKTKWIHGEWIFGTVEKVAENSWWRFLPNDFSSKIGIPPYIAEKNELTEGLKIKIRTKLSSCGGKIHVTDVHKLIQK